jgi:Peptidase family M1 domain/Peptidase M1 N-terminal domain
MKKCRTLLPVTPAFFAVAVFASLALLTALSLKAQRLPDSVVPEHYALTLTPDLNAATFSGVETIDVAIKAPTNTVTLNAAEIAFQSVNVSAAGKQQTAGIALDAEKQQAIFFFPSALPVGKASLQIHFTGLLNNELRGFYLSKTGRRNYAVTQFEPTDARRAFPCFDEPALKASYDISLVVDRGDTAISNNPIANDKPGPVEGKHTITFSTTPRMSTYLVAFLVGDFECTSGEQDGVAIRSCAAPEKKAFTPYGLEVGKFSLHYFNTYFGIPYPLKKLDLIAVPDFEAGAMENFGAITFRESDFLLDPKSASIDSEKQVGLVIAHEIAHQWFGDLVTMQWWDNIWLNEGFATWMENKAIATMHPEWNLGQDVAADMDRALNIDANPTTRAIRAKADTPDEINQMFDGIAYDKAGNVLLSIENFIGEDAFRRGVHNYLTSHLYGNATAEDFWNAEAAASHKPVDRIMDSLITEPGVPLLTFGEPNAGKVSVSQHRFYLSPSIQPDPSQKWTLPVCFKAGPDSKQCDVLTPQTAYLKVPSTPLFFANATTAASIRPRFTRLSSRRWNLVSHQRNASTLSATNGPGSAPTKPLPATTSILLPQLKTIRTRRSSPPRSTASTSSTTDSLQHPRKRTRSRNGSAAISARCTSASVHPQPVTRQTPSSCVRSFSPYSAFTATTPQSSPKRIRSRSSISPILIPSNPHSGRLPSPSPHATVTRRSSITSRKSTKPPQILSSRLAPSSGSPSLRTRLSLSAPSTSPSLVRSATRTPHSSSPSLSVSTRTAIRHGNSSNRTGARYRLSSLPIWARVLSPQPVRSAQPQAAIASSNSSPRIKSRHPTRHFVTRLK